MAYNLSDTPAITAIERINSHEKASAGMQFLHHMGISTLNHDGNMTKKTGSTKLPEITVDIPPLVPAHSPVNRCARRRSDSRLNRGPEALREVLPFGSE
jgi:hypothetical protein